MSGEQNAAHDAAWRAAHDAGAQAYRKWRAENWPERDCAAAAVAAGVMAYEAMREGQPDQVSR